MLLPEDVRDEFAWKFTNKKFTGNTIEIIGESFLASEPSLFGQPNHDYIMRELDWYQSASLNVNDIPGGAPKIWQQISSESGEINSNYGFLLFSDENHMQLDNVVKHLIADQGTRRATAVYTRPTIHQDWNRDGMTDFICTNAVQYLIRDGLLHVVVQMRSNDIVFGYRNDWAWQKYVQEILIQDLAENDIFVKPGSIVWNAASLHMYERHFWMLENYIETGDPFPELR
ncbi:ThyA Thymidylate synthase [uncultured Caudovirales phage]|uniref:ThyA Thymidylate synthase n=1 Tax=uncultured Caudovirales phage TaxID=2100421 RepID=A0A6J5NBP7_9CAUD|nr:ThyA Thymidylate synthase [uncultured Caudovirales phage]